MNNSLHSEEKDNSNKTWFIILYCNIFLFLMGFIQSGVVIALFFVIWGSILYLTIFLSFRHLENLELKEVKRKTKYYTNGTEVINGSYTTVKNKNEFRIENDKSSQSYSLLFIPIILLAAISPSFVLPIIDQAINHSEIRVGPFYIGFILIFIMILSIPFIIPYLYYRNQITVCSIDKISKVILFKKISPKQKDLKKIFFSDVMDFGYYLTDSMTSTYSLKVKDRYGVRITLFEGREEKCIDLYNKISDFLGSKSSNE